MRLDENKHVFMPNWLGFFSLWKCSVIIVFIVLVFVRIYHLGADPPVYLSPSGGIFGDEMALAHSARNKVLFGSWITDDWNPFIYNPILTILEYLSFKLLGVGLIQLRLVNIIAVLSGFFLLFITLKKSCKNRVALIAVLLLGINYVFIMYSRLGLNDTFLIFPMTLTLYLWQKGLKTNQVLFLAGISSFACYVTKASALYFVFAVFLALLFAIFQKYKEDGNLKRACIPLIYYLGGLGISYTIWYVLFFSPYKIEFAKISASWFRLSMPSNFSSFWHNLRSFTFPRYLTGTPVELVLSWSYVPFLIYGILRNWRKVQPIEVFVFLWAFGGYIALSGLNYRPLRYYIPLIPPVCILASFALNKIWEKGSFRRFSLNKGSLFRASLFWLASAFWINIFVKYCIGYSRTLKGVLSVFVITIIFILFYFILNKIRLDSITGYKRGAVQIAMRSLFVSIITLTLYFNGSHYLRWANNAKYTVMDISRELGGMLNKAYIAGLWSPLVTIENKHRALFLGNNWYNYKDTFEKYPVTHLFLWDGNNAEELRFLKRAYPNTMKNARLLKVYTIKGRPVRLFELNNEL